MEQKQRDLEERTFRFAESVRALVKQLPKTISNVEDIRQLVRASGSVAANWVEADEALSRKDFLMRVEDLPERGEREPFVSAVSRSRLDGSHRLCSRQAGGRGARTDAHFFFDYLES